jgi:hypothetical protein
LPGKNGHAIFPRGKMRIFAAGKACHFLEKMIVAELGRQICKNLPVLEFANSNSIAIPI